MAARKHKSLDSTNTSSSKTGLTRPCCNEPIYEIHVKGHLDSSFSEWLDGLEVNLLEDGVTVLCGPIIDQSALMGVLNKLARLSLTIISLCEVNPKNHKEKK